MVENPSPELWAQLRASRPTAEDVFATHDLSRNDDDFRILMGMDQAGDLHLLIPVSAGPRSPEPADLNGLRVRHRVTEVDQFLDLVASASHERIFTPFCREMIEAVCVRGREPWSAAASLVRQWQSAWRPTRQAMSKTVQVGLAGELLILLRIMIPVLGPEAVFHWSGPDRERHDFICGNLHLEVKTTRASRHEHEISRMDQLWVPEGRRLLIGSVELEESIGGVITLAALVDEVVALVSSDPAAVDDFLTKLSRLEWDDEMRRSGELLRFNVRAAALYEVDEAFPRLPLTFVPPNGVIAVRYTISLANLAPLDWDDVMALVAGANAAAGPEVAG